MVTTLLHPAISHRSAGRSVVTSAACGCFNCSLTLRDHTSSTQSNQLILKLLKRVYAPMPVIVLSWERCLSVVSCVISRALRALTSQCTRSRASFPHTSPLFYATMPGLYHFQSTCRYPRFLCVAAVVLRSLRPSCRGPGRGRSALPF